MAPSETDALFEASRNPAEPQKFYLTTPIYYVNARPHIGHAYTTVVADVLARRHRLLGHETFFLTGTDEHGQKIERSAGAAGIPPQQFADGVSAQFKALWDRMGLTYDRYIRTTDPDHKRGAQVLFAELFRLGHIYLASYTGSYCVSDEAFVDLPAGTPCPDCGRPLETVTEENFFFRLSAFQLPLLNLIESNTLRITPEGSRNEVLSFLRGNPDDAYFNATYDTAKAIYGGTEAETGRPTHQLAIEKGYLRRTSPSVDFPVGSLYVPGALKDLSISRSSFTWGIPVPQPAASLTKEPHVIYVWLDALANYMTAIGYGNPDPAAQQEFQKWWPANLHLVGKEITRFHCIYWPAFLLALNPATATTSASEAVILSEAKDPRISSSLQTTPGPEGAPSVTQSGMGRNVDTPGITWATPQAEWSPEEHGLPPEPPSQTTPEPQGAPVMAENDMSGNLRPQSAELSPTDHAAWAQRWLPKQITANGWLLFDNSKMSKSKGNVVRTETILDAFGTLCPPKPVSLTHVPTGGVLAGHDQAPSPTIAALNQATQDSAPNPHHRDLFAADVLRYYLLREIPFGQDGSFSFEALVTRYNADLANGYGNLVSRTLKMIADYYSGEMPPHGEWSKITIQVVDRIQRGGSVGMPDSNTFHNIWDTELSRVAKASEIFYEEAFSKLIFSRGFDTETVKNALTHEQKVELDSFGVTDATTFLVQQVDAYITKHQPWKLAKSGAFEDRTKLDEVLYTAAESIRIITALLHPILPYATAQVWTQLGLGSIEAAAKNGDLRNLQWGGLQPGTQLGPLGPIFPRADKSLIETMTNMEIANIPIAPKPALTPITDNNDATHPETSPFPEAPFASAAATTEVIPSALTDELAGSTTPTPSSPTDPGAGPRPLSPANPGTTVAGSHAITTERPGTPSHTEATPSGIFASGPIPVAPAVTTAPTPSSTPADQSPEITIDDFAKIDLRVAQVLVCERIPKADKLLRLEVDLGPIGRRQILSGIAEHYTPESLVGRRIIVITNLAPRKMRGLESHGMLLAANGPEIDGKPGKPILATTAEDTPLGSRLK